MGVEVKGAGDGVVIAERGCNDGCGCRDHSGWGSGWGAVRTLSTKWLQL